MLKFFDKNIFVSAFTIMAIYYYLVSYLSSYYLLSLIEAMFGVEYVYLSSVILYSLVLFVLVIIYNSLRKKNNNVILEWRFKDILIIILAALFFRILVDPLLRIENIIQNTSIPDFVKKDIPLGYFITSFLSFVILVPIIEEIIFRGIILNRLFKTQIPLVSILYSSFLFLLIHINYLDIINTSLIRLVYIFILGLIIGYIYYKSKLNLIYVILFHIITNFIALFIKNQEHYDEIINYLNFDFKYWFIVGFGGFGLIFILSFVNKMNRGDG